MVNVWTSISGAIEAGQAAFRKSPYQGRWHVIDVSGDGANNGGTLVTVARDLALVDGITINGLLIVNDKLIRYGRPQIPNLDYYYTD